MIHLIPLLSFVAIGIQASPLRHVTRADGDIPSAILGGTTYLNKVSYFSYVHDCTCMLSALFRALLGLDSFRPPSRTLQAIPWGLSGVRCPSKGNRGRRKTENSLEFSSPIQIAVTTCLSLPLSLCPVVPLLLMINDSSHWHLEHRKGTVNYQARRHEIEFTFTPYYDSAPLDYTTAAKTLQLTYLKTTLLYDRLHNTTTGLDPTAVRPTSDVPKDPQVPIVSTDDPRLSLDIEGSVEDKDGSYVFLFLFVMSLRDLTFTFFSKRFWVSDEYGPYIYHYSKDGELISIIQPPDAILPRDSNGNLNFTGTKSQATGRSANQGTNF